MKPLFVSMAIVTLVLGSALSAASQTSTTPATSTSQTSKAKSAVPARTAKARTHVVGAEFVSYDASAKTVTVKEANGQTSSVKLEGSAAAAASRFKQGDKVRVTWRDNANGEHQAITAIRPAKRRA